ncbi:MAG: aminoglycoside phosphotransferase family protein [Anaerolineae bacterium]|jgi:aminoglycoside 2''-phosphotransferase|nr:aminoglycoside phosphotransferase family protein [Anaerolineae bacterium]
MNDQLNPFLDQIKAAIPDIQIHSAEIMRIGEINDVVLVNDTLVFRFPRLPEDAERLEYEHELLTALWDHLPLPIPNPVFHQMEVDAQPFMEYVHLAGEPLCGYTQEAKAHCKHIAVQLADFVQDLHNAPLDDLALPVQNAGRKDRLPHLHEAIQAVLFPHLNEAAQHRISRVCADYMNRPDVEGEKLVVRHGDLGPNNILIDPKNFDITGIIDFGSAGWDEPASDLGHIAFWGTMEFGEEFVETFLKRYGVDDALRERLQFYATLIACVVAMGALEGNSGNTLQAALQFLNQE